MIVAFTDYMTLIKNHRKTTPLQLICVWYGMLTEFLRNGVARVVYWSDLVLFFNIFKIVLAYLIVTFRKRFRLRKKIFEIVLKTLSFWKTVMPK